MSERCLGGLFNNDELLWFIIVFLLLFYRRPFCGPVGPVGC
ncbi:MAG: hypothetical protein N2645_03080 [Clostridia bacterium]|nr:hypothetical protein [Clostridia bacterium]